MTDGQFFSIFLPPTSKIFSLHLPSTAVTMTTAAMTSTRMTIRATEVSFQLLSSAVCAPADGADKTRIVYEPSTVAELIIHILCVAWTFFCTWILKLVDSFGLLCFKVP